MKVLKSNNKSAFVQRTLTAIAIGSLVITLLPTSPAGAATTTTQSTMQSSYTYSLNLGAKFAKKAVTLTLNTKVGSKTTKNVLGTFTADASGSVSYKTDKKLNASSTVSYVAKGLSTITTNVSKLKLVVSNLVPDVTPAVGPFTYTVKVGSNFINKSAAITFVTKSNSKTVTTKIGDATVDSNGNVTFTIDTKLDPKGSISVNVWGFNPITVAASKLAPVVTPVVQPIVPPVTPTPTPTPTPTVAPTPAPTAAPAVLEDGLTPKFGTLTPGFDGYVLQITNYDTLYSWSAIDAKGGKVAISGTGLITVTNLQGGVTTQLTVTTSRTGYKDGSASTPFITTLIQSFGGGGGGTGGGTGGASTFTISYDANGGVGTTVDTTNYSSGAAVTVMANNFTFGTHSFVSWNTVRNGTGVSYIAGSSLNITANVTLYAQWNLSTQTISFLQPVPMRVGSPVQPLEAAATSGLPVSYTSITPLICTVVNGTRLSYVHSVAPGACTIEATQLGSTAITAANPVQQTFTILAANDARVILIIDPNGGSFTTNRTTYFNSFGIVLSANTTYTLPAATNVNYAHLAWAQGDINGAAITSPYQVTADTIIVAKWS